jgi:hypothetical protein
MLSSERLFTHTKKVAKGKSKIGFWKSRIKINKKNFLKMQNAEFEPKT